LILSIIFEIAPAKIRASIDDSRKKSIFFANKNIMTDIAKSQNIQKTNSGRLIPQEILGLQI
jgi:hypothetical protein